VLFLVMYSVYIILMYFNRHIEAWVVVKFPCLSHESVYMKRQHVESVPDSEVLVTSTNIELSQSDVDADDASKICLLF